MQKLIIETITKEEYYATLKKQGFNASEHLVFQTNFNSDTAELLGKDSIYGPAFSANPSEILQAALDTVLSSQEPEKKLPDPSIRETDDPFLANTKLTLCDPVSWTVSSVHYFHLELYTVFRPSGSIGITRTYRK